MHENKQNVPGYCFENYFGCIIAIKDIYRDNVCNINTCGATKISKSVKESERQSKIDREGDGERKRENEKERS